MATAERDYYDLLGVERTATDAEIKKAFRKLARELHPDVNAEPDAQERFRAVAEAYEVLSDAERRRLYDSSDTPASAVAAMRRATSPSRISPTSSPRSSATTSSPATAADAPGAATWAFRSR